MVWAVGQSVNCIFAAPIELSEVQIDAFDELYDFDSNRPTQPVNDRAITMAP